MVLRVIKFALTSNKLSKHLKPIVIGLSENLGGMSKLRDIRVEAFLYGYAIYIITLNEKEFSEKDRNMSPQEIRNIFASSMRVLTKYPKIGELEEKLLAFDLNDEEIFWEYKKRGANLAIYV